jgi:hypothetical protein
MQNENFRYDLLVEDALRNVVRQALHQAGKDGLTDGHHFYITFRTDYQGVVMPDYLREKYPRDITIVLEHKFWDLTVTEEQFSVTLSFHKVPENLVVPFPALSSFADPSVNFVLQFNVEAGELAEPAEMPVAATVEEVPVAEQPTPADAPADAETEKSGEVIALDAFRKK